MYSRSTEIGCGAKANYGTIKGNQDVWNNLNQLDALRDGASDKSTARRFGLIALYQRDEGVARSVAVFLFTVFMGGVLLLISALVCVQVLLIANEVQVRATHSSERGLEFASLAKWGPDAALVLVFVEFFVVGFVVLTGSVLIVVKLAACFSECKCDIFFQFYFFSVALAFSWGSLFEIMRLFQALAAAIYAHENVWASPYILTGILTVVALDVVCAYVVFFSCTAVKKIVISEGVYSRFVKGGQYARNELCGRKIVREGAVYKAFICSACLNDRARRNKFQVLFERLSAAWRVEEDTGDAQQYHSHARNGDDLQVIDEASETNSANQAPDGDAYGKRPKRAVGAYQDKPALYTGDVGGSGDGGGGGGSVRETRDTRKGRKELAEPLLETRHADKKRNKDDDRPQIEMSQKAVKK